MRSLRRPLALLAAVVGSIVLQTTLFGRLQVDGIAPDVVLLTLVLASLRLRTDRALLVAFAAGLVFDALTATAIGLRAFTYTAIVYVARRTHERADFSPAATAVWAAVMTLLGVVLLLTVGTLFGQFDFDGGEAIRRMLLVPLFNLILALVATPVIARLLEPRQGILR